MNSSYYAGAWTWGNPNELYHHGIMGQRWGKRNGPPYPLAPSAHSSAEKRLRLVNEGALESWKNEQSTKANKRYDKKISRIEKKIAKSSKSLETANEMGAGSKTLQRKQDKIRKLVEKGIKTKAMKALENEAISKMNIDDVNDEELKVIKAEVKDALITVGSMVLASKGVIPFYVIGATNTREVRQDSRFNMLNAKQKSGDKSGVKTDKNVTFVANRAKGMRTSGLSYAQIARKLGIPLSSVSYYLSL